MADADASSMEVEVRKELFPEAHRSAEAKAEATPADEAHRSAEAKAVATPADEAHRSAEAKAEATPTDEDAQGGVDVEKAVLQEQPQPAQLQEAANVEAGGEDNQAKGVGAACEVGEIASKESRQAASRWCQRRKRDMEASKETLVKNAEKLEKEASKAQEVAGEHVAVLEEMKKKLREQEEKTRAQQEVVAAARRAAAKARQEVALHELPLVRQKPPTAFGIFCNNQRLTIKKAAQMWNDMGAEQKQKYRDVHDAEMKEWAAWSKSEEGKALLAKRRAALKAQKSSSGTAASVPQASAESEKAQDASTSPAKRERMEPKPTPNKQRRTILTVMVNAAKREMALVEH